MADKLGRLSITVWLLLMAAEASGQSARMDRATATFGGGNYVVQAGDVLRVRIWGWPQPESEIEGSFPVEAEGTSFLPVIGALPVAGKTAEQVQEEFRRRFAQEQRNPVVTVTPYFVVSMMGEVNGPGVIDVRPGYTVFDAISTAGGFTANANRNSVLLIRKGVERTVGGMTATAAARAMAEVPLESGDRILIGRNRTSKVQFWTLVLQGVFGVANLVLLLRR